MWIHLSAEQGFRHAIQVRDDLDEQMTVLQIAYAKVLAQACRFSNYKICG